MNILAVDGLKAGIPGMTSRPLGPGDCRALAALEASVFDDAWDEAQFGALLGQERFLAVGAFAGGTLVGYLTGYNLAGELEIVNVAVAPDFRGRGVGLALLRFALAEACRAGAARAVLEVRSGNVAARALYARCGFTRVGLRKGYYTDSGEDALILEWTACPES